MGFLGGKDGGHEGSVLFASLFSSFFFDVELPSSFFVGAVPRVFLSSALFRSICSFHRMLLSDSVSLTS